MFYIPHNYVILQAMPHAIPQTHSSFYPHRNRWALARRRAKTLNANLKFDWRFLLDTENEWLILDEKVNIIERRVRYKKLLQLVKFYGDNFPTP